MGTSTIQEKESHHDKNARAKGHLSPFQLIFLMNPRPTLACFVNRQVIPTWQYERSKDWTSKCCHRPALKIKHGPVSYTLKSIPGNQADNPEFSSE